MGIKSKAAMKITPGAWSSPGTKEKETTEWTTQFGALP